MRAVGFEERVACSEALERVIDGQRIWPPGNRTPRPAFEERLPRRVIEARVDDYLRKGVALERIWHRPITTEQLQAEVDRMARDTQAPETLQALFRALENDPVLVAECLARPLLTDRLMATWFASDGRLHTKARGEAVDLATWWAAVRLDFEPSVPLASGFVRLLALGGAGATRGASCDAWAQASNLVGPPTARGGHTAVWTGSEMIVWGGGFRSGGRYSPATDTWAATPTGGACPSARTNHTAVWTGTEMIVWGGGGSNGLNSGGRYSPATDTWMPTSTTGACPVARERHTAVWTGTEMIVWGGTPGAMNSGGRYDPSTDTWAATSTAGACPVGRYEHTAVWTGAEMVIWGGNGYENTGGRYDPVVDSWTPTSTAAGCPQGRGRHTAVWSGTEMIVWGGPNLATGGRYSPAADAWTPTSTSGACPSWRVWHAAVWTGTEMIVWGGAAATLLGDGARYRPASDTWITVAAGPTPRGSHSMVWTGSEVIVWGGSGSETGGRYDPGSDTWVPTSTGGARPSARDRHTAVWTGAEMIVWGGDYHKSGGRYAPATDTWTATSTGPGCPTGRIDHTAVWTGSDMIVWGGSDLIALQQSGGRYSPVTDTWTVTSTGPSCPTARRRHSAVWTGSEMIVWGGGGMYGAFFDTGGRYAPASDTWTATSTAGACPGGRESHTAVWTGTEMIVWGNFINTGGGRYSPASDTWTATSTGPNCPSSRVGHSAVWTGAEMIVWGGTALYPESTGGRYDPATDTWAVTSTAGRCPAARAGHTAVWTGAEMIVWGGYAGEPQDTGGRYLPSIDAWVTTSEGGGRPSPRIGHTSVWTGESMIVWGGDDYSSTGGRYVLTCPASCFLLGAGLGQPNAPQVEVYTPVGVPSMVAFAAYAAGGWGANVGSGNLDGGPFDEILTGPGPGDVYGPHVRGWSRSGISLGKVSFYAYGTLKYGTNVSSGDVDGDSWDEILTGPGPGAAFGPHVRGFDYDAAALVPIAKVNFYAYGTLRYGVNVVDGSVDGDRYAEIATGPGPGPTFSPQVRGFDYDAASVTAIAKINYDALPYAGYGVNLALGDVDGDSFAEIATTAGPGPAHPSRFVGHGYDGVAIVPLGGFDATPFPTSFGGRVGAGDAEPDGREDLLCGGGRDVAADSTVEAYRYAWQQLGQLPVSFVPFGPLRYGVNVVAGRFGY